MILASVSRVETVIESTHIALQRGALTRLAMVTERLD
jgi:hypothetical protein